MPEPSALYQDTVRTYEELRTLRANWEGTWREIGALVLPRRLDYRRGLSGTGTPSTDGQLLTRQIFDPTATFAAEQLASFLGTQLINPQEDWIELRFRDERLADDQAAAIWLRQIKNLLMSEFNSPDSSFHVAMSEAFLELVVFGTCHVSMTANAFGRPVFVARPLAELYVTENADHEIDTHYRKFDWTARQILQHFNGDVPDPLGTHIAKLSASDRISKQFSLLHAVYPREDFDPRLRDPTNMPWASIWLCLDPPTQIRVGGFRDSPFVTSRWTKVPGDVYGRSPAFTVMPDIRVLQVMTKVVISAAQTRAKKTLLVPDDGFIGGGGVHRFVPGGLVPYRATADPSKAVIPLDLADEPGIGLELIEHRQQNVLRAFFVDVIRGISMRGDASPLKATEVIERRNEALQALVPPLTRMQREALSPLVTRAYRLMARNRLLPPPPDHIVDADFDIEFVAPAVLAARVGEAEKMVRALSQVALLAELDPAIIENIERDLWTRRILRLNGVSPDLLAPEGTAAEFREEMRSREAAGQLVQGGAEVAKAAGALR